MAKPHPFDLLTPDRVLDLVEAAQGVRCNGICRARASYINRVFEIGLNDGGFLIAKFYRPGRWSREALRDELDFVTELAADELPVVPPLADAAGRRLHTTDDDVPFAIYPRRGGRPVEELTPGDWEQVGRLLARLHNVGARHAPRDRIALRPDISMRAHLRCLLDGGFIPGRLRDDYRTAVEDILAASVSLFEGVPTTRIHGDCHRGNLLQRPGEALCVIDFDDMAVGPAMQDIWMLLPGHPKDSQPELHALAEGYETFRPFEWQTLRLVESLRAMRYVHYAAWCARQQADQGLVQTVPDWGSPAYWRQEIELLSKQREEIVGAIATASGFP